LKIEKDKNDCEKLRSLVNIQIVNFEINIKGGAQYNLSYTFEKVGLYLFMKSNF